MTKNFATRREARGYLNGRRSALTDPPPENDFDSAPPAAAREPRPEVPIAHRLRQFQRRLGRVLDEGELAEVADRLGTPLSRLRSVAGFFEEFVSPPVPAPVFRACGDLACTLASMAGRKGAKRNQAKAEPLSCLGRCHQGPVRVDRFGELHVALAEEAPAGCLAPEARLTRTSWEKETDACVAILRREPDPAAAIRQRLAAVTSLDRHRRKPGDRRTLLDRWDEAARTPAQLRFLVCHAEAGNPGSTGHAWLLRNRPAAVIDGMILAATLVGAAEGVICVHHDLPEVFTAIDEAIRVASAAGKLAEGEFELSVVATFGSHVGGEETALLNAIEGRRGEARTRPLQPETAGVFGLPTVIETAETFALLPGWLSSERDPGHRLMTLLPPFGRPGVVEIDASVSIRGAMREGTTVLSRDRPEALFLGGPFGSVIFPEDWDLRLDAEVLEGLALGPGNWSLAPLPRDADLRALARHWLEFAARESCGKCAPCRLGPLAAREMLDSRDLRGRDRFAEILDTVRDTSLCGFGRDFPRPLRQLLDHFGAERLFDQPGGDTES